MRLDIILYKVIYVLTYHEDYSSKQQLGSSHPQTALDTIPSHRESMVRCLRDSPIALALWSDKTVPVHKAGSIEEGLILKLRYSDHLVNIEKKLTGEEYKSICVLESFINNLQNNYGPVEVGMFDISTTISRNSFTYFDWTRFGITNPIVYDENKAIASQDRRLKALHYQNSKTVLGAHYKHDSQGM